MRELAAIEKLIHELSKLPGVGDKTALRLALHVLRQPPEYGQSLAKALETTLSTVRFCSECFHLSTATLCPICDNPIRNQRQLCVVEEVSDLLSLERTGVFKGRYHVLHGSLSPIDGIGPEDLKCKELITRLNKDETIEEVILATNPDVTGEATALYLTRLLKPLTHVTITKLASGIPVGGHLEFVDQNTLSKAFERRQKIDGGLR